MEKQIHLRWRYQLYCVEQLHNRHGVVGNIQNGDAVIVCVSEPFERNNVARAVHEKAKFDAIRAQFAEVQDNNCCSSHPLWSTYELFLILLASLSSQSFHILKQRRDLNSILPIRDIITKESSMRWGVPAFGWADWVFYLKTGLCPGSQRPLGCVWNEESSLSAPTTNTKWPWLPRAWLDCKQCGRISEKDFRVSATCL